MSARSGTGIDGRWPAGRSEEESATGAPPRSFRHGTAMLAHMTDTQQQARDLVHGMVVPFFTRAHAEYVMLEERIGDQPPPEAMGELFLETQAIGPIELCVERIAARLAVPGVSRVLLHVESAGEHEAILANLDRLATDVVPRVRAALGVDPVALDAPAGTA